MTISTLTTSAAGQASRASPTHVLAPEPTSESLARRTYLCMLMWLFTAFNSLRLVSYLPTLHAIQASGDSSQHSLLTWLTWTGANATMAAWLYEANGRRMDRAISVNICNAVMCAASVALVLFYRLV